MLAQSGSRRGRLGLRSQHRLRVRHLFHLLQQLRLRLDPAHHSNAITHRFKLIMKSFYLYLLEIILSHKKLWDIRLTDSSAPFLSKISISSLPINVLPLLEVLVLRVRVGHVVVVVLLAAPAADVASREASAEGREGPRRHRQG